MHSVPAWGVDPRASVGSKAQQASSGSYHSYQSQPQTKCVSRGDCQEDGHHPYANHQQQDSLHQCARQHPECLTDQLIDWFSDDMFFIMIKQLCKILEAFTLVNQAVQAACATLADNHTVLAVFGKGQYYSCPFSSSSMQAGQARPGSMLCGWEEHFR